MELEKAMAHANVKLVMMVPTVIIVQKIILSFRIMVLLLVKNVIHLVKIAVQIQDQKVRLSIILFNIT